LSIPLIQADRVGRQSMSVEAALRAVDECGAPMVSIPGGEPLIHNDMAQIVAGIVVRRKFVYVCTNALLLPKHIDEYRPSPYLTFSIHLDGGRKRHDEPFARKAYSTRRLRPYDWHAARAFE
jgi:MoaA/NifB/PqqE/SkfB family radical SAM enzyme